MLEQDFEEMEANLRYELKVNDLALISTEKQTLIQCFENILGLMSGRLVEIICQNIEKQKINGTLPQKLLEMFKDDTLLQQYRKYPNLVNFQKITLEMISQLHQTKITVYSLNYNGVLTGLIINEQGYQQNLKIARINSVFYEVKDCIYSSAPSFGGKFSSNSNSSKIFEAFQSDKKIKEPEQTKTLPQIPLLTTKSMSNVEPPRSPPINEVVQKAPDQISLENYHSIEPQPLNSVPSMEEYQQQQNHNMFYQYNQYPYYQPTSYMYGNENKSEGFIHNYNMPNSQPLSPSKMSSSRRQASTKLIEIDENLRYTGRLKFFDDAKNYGFIIMDADDSDIFVHCDDLQKAGISKDRVKSYKQSDETLRFEFRVMSYIGKYKQSRKAVELMILDSMNNPIGKPLYQ